MEFPDLGQHCSEVSCNKLDFLPMKCDGCKKIYCKDHFRYAQHGCSNSHNVQVPVCPLCSCPVPGRREDPPDVAVSSHLDRECRSDPRRPKAYSNRCSVKGCKQREAIPLECDRCRRNHCLKHRHPNDHECSPVRTTNVHRTATSVAAAARHAQVPPAKVASRTPQGCLAAARNDLAEDEALALALQQSLYEMELQEPRNARSEVHAAATRHRKNCTVS